MAITVEITNVMASDSGEQYKGKMHNVSATLILKDGETTVFEQSFSSKHKDVNDIKDTMEKIRIQMDAAKKKYEGEVLLKTDAEKEVVTMTSKLEVG